MQSQVKIIPVWKDVIPNEIINPQYTENQIYKDSIFQKTSNVSVPTLTIYFPEKANGTSILIFPGGGYEHLSMCKEGEKVAKWLNSLGITAFVLKYRLPSDKIMKDKSIGPLQDAQEAIRIIRRNALEWKINKIGVIGFSAGGHLAASLSTRFNENFYSTSDTASSRPDFSLLIYPVISMKNEITHKRSQANLLGNKPSKKEIETFSVELSVTNETPNTFIVHATDDKSVPVENSINYYLALKKNNVPAEIHLYEKGGHGFGLGVKDTSKFWTDACINWLKSLNYL
ncbi:alpha/beta hydrolase [Flavobacterium capsici]|uniref:Alpha/beta hydrolase n=1 Tax=Flavobacterium capsici TaxID=3075618 RepID=A0AA96ESN3_9FLAO|nr:MULTISPECIES: alpha/beta hydrolase [unclassified Flavobacterium]WNM17733.1 alpha/beta hydrolase [Flavobacterium sp. PMR2A8]WNM21786.1 alpha/beta hydrolase [Flavobacterium sp. PMTSA4]